MDSIVKITNMVEKEFTQTKLDLKKYDHKFVCSSLKYSIEKGLDGQLAQPVEELLNMIVRKGAPKTSNLLGANTKAPLGKSFHQQASLLKSESRNQLLSNRDSIVSSMSSLADETVMTDMADYFDEDKVAIYQVVEDLVKIVEVQQIIKQNKVWAKTNNLISPERQQRPGLNIDDISSDFIQLDPFGSPMGSEPFTYYEKEAIASKPLTLEDRHKMTHEMIQEIFDSSPLDIISNIDESFIDRVHHNCKKHLNMIIEKISHPTLLSSKDSDSLIQRLNNVKKQHGSTKGAMHGLLYAMNILNISLVFLINHMYEGHQKEKHRLMDQLTTLVYSEFYNKEYVLKYKDRTIQQIRDEADAKEREDHLIQNYDTVVRIIQRSWRQWKGGIRIC